MKKITEMTEPEILALKQEDLEKLVKLAMAEEGIKIVSCPEEPEYRKLPEKDITVYTVGNYSYFKDIKEAQKIADMLSTMSFMEYSYNYSDYSNRYYENVEKRVYTIGTEKGYSKKVWVNAEDDIRHNKELKDQYETAKKEYDESIKLASSIKSEIFDTYNDVVRKYNRLDKFCRNFKNDYLPLFSQFENNEELAMIAMNKAFNLNADEQEYILKNY
jgi:hypothetical protein